MWSLYRILAFVGVGVFAHAYGKMSRQMKMSVNTGGNLNSLIKSNIDSNKIMVFSKTYCPYCTKVKDTFAKMDIKFGVIELDQNNLGDQIQKELLAMTGQRTVPNVFVGGKHLGGCDDTHAAISSGKFKDMLAN